MPSTTKHTVGLWIAIASSLALVACAQGVGGAADADNGDEVDAKRIDAPQVIDAPRPIDAPPLPTDARIVDALVLPIDASMGTVPTGGACLVNSECAVAGDCCPFGAFTCQPGFPVPPPVNCFPI